MSPSLWGAKDDDMTILPRILPDRLALALLLALVAVLAVSNASNGAVLYSAQSGFGPARRRPTTDSNLVNPWGIVFPPKGPSGFRIIMRVFPPL